MKQQNENNRLENISQLQWACRRGMLELDVLLGNFLKKGYQALSLEEKKHFIALLNYPDPQLFAWFLGQEVPEDQGLVNIIKIIRSYA